MANTQSDKPRHRATYARDKRKGGYLIRVQGPYPHEFAGRTVPVTTRDGQTHDERLNALIWTGADQDTGELVALYSFESRPREEAREEMPF